MCGQIDHRLLAFHSLLLMSLLLHWLLLMSLLLLLFHLGCLFLLFQVNSSGESEVAQLYLCEIFSDEYVFGFEVSVEDL